jgi:hypothetical protein
VFSSTEKIILFSKEISLPTLSPFYILQLGEVEQEDCLKQAVGLAN